MQQSYRDLYKQEEKQNEKRWNIQKRSQESKKELIPISEAMMRATKDKLVHQIYYLIPNINKLYFTSWSGHSIFIYLQFA